MTKAFWQVLGLAGVLAMLTGCGGGGGNGEGPVVYTLDASASGAMDTRNNIVNVTIVSKDANDLKAEYRAGFIQGKLQGTKVVNARDNTWDNSYLTDPDHTFPKQPGPTQAELQLAQGALLQNYTYFLAYLQAPTTDPVVAYRLKRLLFRMLGIYHGVTRADPQALDFSGTWLPDTRYLQASELALGYETKDLTFMDLYFINAFQDFSYLIPDLLGLPAGVGEHPEKCSAFLKRSGGEILLTHNSWMGFLSQTMVQTLVVNGTSFTMNSSTPGQIGSGTDFGYNNKGILFNETTHRYSTTVTKKDGIWVFWRATLAEQFSASISEFFDAMSIDESGTYMNGYMLADARSGESGLIEMSYRCHVYYRSNGGSYAVTSRSYDGKPCGTTFDDTMVTPAYQMGINYPASYQVVKDLGSSDNRPQRRVQFAQLLPGVASVEQAKAVITYTDPGNPLSIFGRWDLGYGQTPNPKQIPDGSVDAKATSTQMVRDFMALSGTLDVTSGATGFWMLFGTAKVGGLPFIWSQSSWSWQKLRDVPDRVDGEYTLMPLYLR